MVGKTISHYRILAKVGEGGMGVVYKAEDTKLKRTVALKFLPPELNRDKEANERFIYEAQTASALDHPNICTIHEIDETKGGRMFIAMGCYEGEALRKKIGHGPLEFEEAMDIGIQIAEGLAKAHQLNIVHRDVNPANIMITSDGIVKIVDFGLAKLKGRSRLTRAGTTLGTVQYMSPEQVQGTEADPRTDIWSLGVVLYEMIAGRPPFSGEVDHAVMYSIVNEEPEPLTAIRSGVPMELERLVKKAMAKNPDERYQHCDELITDLKRLPKQVTSPGKVISSTKVRAQSTQVNKRRRILLVTGIVLAVSLLVLLKTFLPDEKLYPIDSIAVLPFENKSPNSEMEYLCDGIADNITNNLSHLSSLKVIASTSVRRYKGKEIDLHGIAVELKVHAILVGRIFQLGKIITIRVELVDTRDNRKLWGEEYNREFQGILDVQQDVTRKISQNLRLRLTFEEEKQLGKTHTQNSAAYQAYLRGLFQANKFTVEGFLRSIDYYQQALRLDPNYALAYVGLASSYVLLGSQHGDRPAFETIAKARDAAQRALELDNELSEGYISLGMIQLFFDWNWAEAESAFLRALELNPNSAMAHQHYALFLSAMGRKNEAVAEVKRAITLNPFSVKTNDDLALYYLDLKQYEKAIEQWQTVLELQPDFLPARRGLGMVYLKQGRHKEAIEKFREAVYISGGQHRYMGYLGWALAETGQTSDALGILDALKQQPHYETKSAIAIAIIYAGLGESDEAFFWLTKAYEARCSELTWIQVESVYDDLRPDPRFNELLKKMGF